MRRIVIAVFLAGVGGHALAADDARQAALLAIADAGAISRMCDRLAINDAVARALADGNAISLIEISPDFDAISALFKLRLEKHEAKPDMACTEGRMLYGVAGSAYPKLMIEK